MARRRFETHHRARGALELKRGHPALSPGRTVYPSTVVSSIDTPRVLVSGFNNRKIGSRVTVGRWKGLPIYTLTLEERATCPTSCHHWRTCYGNAMHLARRVRHGSEFEARLAHEVGRLHKEHGGLVVRLHVLGDFYSAGYVRLWGWLIDTLPGLRVFGYTAHSPGSIIGAEVATLRARAWDRFAVRFSRARQVDYVKEALTIHGDILLVDPTEELKLVGGFMCPAQLKDHKHCGNCAACWESIHNVVFVEHGGRKRGR